MSIVGDELLSDSFPYKEIENGALWEVEGKVRILDLTKCSARPQEVEYPHPQILTS